MQTHPCTHLEPSAGRQLTGARYPGAPLHESDVTLRHGGTVDYYSHSERALVTVRDSIDYSELAQVHPRERALIAAHLAEFVGC